MQESLFKKLESLYPEMVELRRDFHAEPELAFEEEVTPRKIASYLQNLGIDVRTQVGGRGVVGTIKGKKPGKTVALRADFDALPIQEETGLPFASKIPGKMHACGHDGHTATLLVLAKALVAMRDELEGTVVLIHQFAEEFAPGGAIAMIEDGCLDGVDAIFGTHLWSPLPYGEVGYSYDRLMAASDRFEVNIQGKGGHGALPHETVDAVMVGSSIALMLQQLVSRNVNPLEPAVVTIASFHAEGAFNVISDTAKLEGTVRTFSESVQDQLIARMEETIKGVCEASGATYSFTYAKGYPAVVNNSKMTELLMETAASFHPAEKLHEIEPVMGGEDFSYYLQRVPGAFFFTGAGNEEKGIVYPHHHPKFDIDERAMLVAAKHLGAAALSFLGTGDKK
ncbi:M20 metallopeptidase family protein [Shouchella clausii]|uniref:Peptidase M20 n=1 Tax=Shouchella clausii TaxID=79880 RepID=A0A268P4R2_SHOCL|nr:M20 family metallopeptidase [Shouchella clausii]PAE90661.1 peptidase M20 [Shouchella clausii]